LPDVAAPRSKDTKVIICVINFELVQRICLRYVNVTDRQTDGQLTIAILHFALHALRRKRNAKTKTMTGIFTKTFWV